MRRSLLAFDRYSIKAILKGHYDGFIFLTSVEEPVKSLQAAEKRDKTTQALIYPYTEV